MTNSEDSYAELCQDELIHLQTEIEKLREVLSEYLLYQGSKLREIRLAQNSIIHGDNSTAHLD